MSGIPVQIGPYEVGPEIGRGGMGVVHRAHDPRLGRDVAIKALPDDLASDPDRLERFEREARVLAALSHQNIASLLGLEEVNGRAYLVLELVDGPTLEDRLRDGPLAVADAIAIAIQIAHALEYAHGRGIVHRDLKPGNVKLVDGEHVKVLDFGLAKTQEQVDVTPESPTLDPGASPTMPGAILGTIGYMSPEQARGKPVDRRTDVWALGCVLFEMLTGRRPFGGETVPDAVAATLRAPIELDLLPPAAPPRVRQVLRRCLERDRAERWHDVADLRLLLADASDADVAPTPTTRGGTRLPWVMLGLTLVGAVSALTLRGTRSDAPPASLRAAHFDVAPPFGTELINDDNAGEPAISPDGSRLVMSVTDREDWWLALRELDDPVPRVLPETRHAAHPVISPDGHHVAYVALDALWRLSLRGGAPARVCSGFSNGSTLFWLDEQTLVLIAPGGQVVSTVPAGGGTPRDVVRARTRDLLAEGIWGFEDGTRIPGRADVMLVSVWVGSTIDDYAIVRLDLADGGVERILDRASQPRFVGGDVLVFQRGAALYAVEFDTETILPRGTPRLVHDQTRTPMWAGEGDWDVAGDGTLVYIPGARRITGRRPVRIAPDGTTTPVFGELTDAISEIVLSRDGTRAAVTTLRHAMEVWVVDIERGQWSRLASGEEYYSPTWSPDDRSIVIQVQAAESDLLILDVAGGEGVSLPRTTSVAGIGDLTPYDLTPQAWIDDERLLVSASPLGDSKILLVDPARGGAAELLVDEDGRPRQPDLSSDGRVLAYLSNRDGEAGVFVAPFPRVTRGRRVTRGESWMPHWRPDTHELYFLTPEGLHRATITVSDDLDAPLTIGTPEPALEGAFALEVYAEEYDVFADGSVVAQRRAPWELAQAVRVVTGWGDHVRAELAGSSEP